MCKKEHRITQNAFDKLYFVLFFIYHFLFFMTNVVNNVHVKIPWASISDMFLALKIYINSCKIRLFN